MTSDLGGAICFDMRPLTSKRTSATKAIIDKAIKHLNLEIIRGDGYQYFLDLTTGDQVGDSVFVCYLRNLTVEQWVLQAERAVKAKEESYV